MPQRIAAEALRWPISVQNFSRDPIPLASLLICGAHLHVQVALGRYCPVKSLGKSASQLDLPSRRPFSVAGCGRLQLGSAHLGYFSSIISTKQSIIDRTNSCSRFSTMRLLPQKTLHEPYFVLVNYFSLFCYWPFIRRIKNELLTRLLRHISIQYM